MASGKGTAAKYIESKYNGNSHRFSTPLRDVLDRLRLQQNRENLQKLSTSVRQAFGEDILARIIFHDAENDPKEIAAIDGVRRLGDIKYLRKLPHFKLIYINTAMEKRYERIIRRAENADDRNKTFLEFQKEQNQESESQIRGLEPISDFIADNNGTLEEFFNQLDVIVEKCQS